MTTVFESLHSDDMIRVGTALKNVTCAKCHELVLPACQHEVGLYEVNHNKVRARRDAAIQESIRRGHEAGNH